MCWLLLKNMFFYPLEFMYFLDGQQLYVSFSCGFTVERLEVACAAGCPPAPLGRLYSSCIMHAVAWVLLELLCLLFYYAVSFRTLRLASCPILCVRAGFYLFYIYVRVFSLFIYIYVVGVKSKRPARWFLLYVLGVEFCCGSCHPAPLEKAKVITVGVEDRESPRRYICLARTDW